jgi:hypothetical protein
MSQLVIPKPDVHLNANVAVNRRAADPEKAKGPFVKYVGIASKRLIRSDHWRSKGIDLKDSSASHTWDIKNKHMIPTSEFSNEQLDYLLVDDLQAKGGHSFLEVDYNDEGQLVQVKH